MKKNIKKKNELFGNEKYAIECMNSLVNNKLHQQQSGYVRAFECLPLELWLIMNVTKVARSVRLSELSGDEFNQGDGFDRATFLFIKSTEVNITRV